MTTIRDGKVTHWRDYLDPVAVWAIGWPSDTIVTVTHRTHAE
ncbi:MAG TPA: hypothetical protein VIV12_14080 [Streptosporangiaceae bacterium]